MPTLNEIAEKNVREHLKDNPCRGIVLGLGENGQQIQVSWIMGRSENSQNRVYVVRDEILKTEAADPSKVKDPSLIIYNVMRSTHGIHVVSNGDQTNTVHEVIKDFATQWDLSPEAAKMQSFLSLEKRYCEPDAPNFTPRITGFQDGRQKYIVNLSVLKAEPFAKAQWIENEEKIRCGDRDFRIHNKQEFPTIRDEFVRTISPGFGYMITTYMPGSKELPSFQGEPLLVPMKGKLEEVMQGFWCSLEPNFRVAVGGKEISAEGARYATPINKFAKKE